MSVRIVDRDRGYRKVVRSAELLRMPGRVTVGVHEGEGGQAHQDGALTVAEVAAIHEFGATVQHADGSETAIPQRSWLGGWFDGALEPNKATLRDAVRAVLEGRMSKQQALELVGAKFVGDMQARIAAGIDPPNAPSTVARKGSSTPLIASGQFRGSITHKVET